jgi:TM2 domain-containing membrane protein YozV
MLETSVLKASISDNPKKSPILAAVLSFLIPGFGQIYSGDRRKGVGFFLIGAMFAMLEIFLIRNNGRGMEVGPVLVAVISSNLFWIFNIYNAHTIAKKKRDENS